MSLPNTYTEKNDTGCCAVPNISEWEDKELTFRDMRFIRQHTRSFMFVPLNMGKIMKSLNEAAIAADALMPPEQAMILSRDLSPWKAEQLYAASKPVEGADNVTLNGAFITKVFEGPYQNAKKWYDAMQEMAKDRGSDIKATYFFYTTCPKCAKHYGKNYTIGLAKI